jgi:hypothetical protein
MKVLGMDLENHMYKDGWGVAYFNFTKRETPIVIEFYSENSFCTDFIAYVGSFDQVEKIKNIDIVHSTKNFIKYKHIDHQLKITEYDKKCVPLYSTSLYLRNYDIYTGEKAEKRIEFYKNLNLLS